MNTRNTILIIAGLCSRTGGALRALQTVEWLLRTFKDVHILVNLTSILGALNPTRFRVWKR